MFRVKCLQVTPGQSRTSRKTGKSPRPGAARGGPGRPGAARSGPGGPGLAGCNGEAGISAQRTATMGHGCCQAGGGNRIYGPSLLRERHPWAIVAVARPGWAASMGHGCVSAGVSSWSAPPHGQGGAGPARSRPDIPAFRAFGAARRPAPGKRGHFTPVKTMAKCPRLPSKTHGTRLTPTETHHVAHRCCCGPGRRRIARFTEPGLDGLVVAAGFLLEVAGPGAAAGEGGVPGSGGGRAGSGLLCGRRDWCGRSGW